MKTLMDGRFIELTCVVLTQGQAGRLICCRDVTERHQRETQLRILSFIRVMCMATLLEKTSLTPLQQNYLSTMRQAGQHLLACARPSEDHHAASATRAR